MVDAAAGGPDVVAGEAVLALDSAADVPLDSALDSGPDAELSAAVVVAGALLASVVAPKAEEDGAGASISLVPGAGTMAVPELASEDAETSLVAVVVVIELADVVSAGEETGAVVAGTLVVAVVVAMLRVSEVVAGEVSDAPGTMMPVAAVVDGTCELKSLEASLESGAEEEV